MKVTINLDELSYDIMWDVNAQVDVLLPITHVTQLEEFLLALARRTQGSVHYGS